MRKFFHKPEHQFLVVSIVILTLIGLTLNSSLSSLIKDNFINDRVDVLSSYLSKHAEQLPPQAFTSSDFESTRPYFEESLHSMKDLGIIRIKVFNSKSQIIYSDESKLIGEEFGENEELSEALKGEVKTEIEEPTKGENRYEQGFSQVMEIYTPIFLGNQKPVGVIEAYYTLDSLNYQIQRTQILIGGILTIGFLSLFLGLYWMFRRTSDQLEIIHQREDQKLKEISRLKDEFVFVVAHELRTPVTAIKAYTAAVLEEAKKLKGDLKSDLEKIEISNNVLYDLVNDLLEVARGDAGKLKINLTSQNIKKTLTVVIEQLQPLADQKHITLEDLTPLALPQVMADQEKLGEVFQNLIGNAIKYNSKGGKVKITHQLKEDFLIINIIDNGIGISPEDQKHLFERFWRSENALVRQNTGTGLGLFITKELVERMEGKIWIESEENKGSTFSFKLKLSPKT